MSLPVEKLKVDGQVYDILPKLEDLIVFSVNDKYYLWNKQNPQLPEPLYYTGLIEGGDSDTSRRPLVYIQDNFYIHMLSDEANKVSNIKYLSSPWDFEGCCPLDLYKTQEDRDQNKNRVPYATITLIDGANGSRLFSFIAPTGTTWEDLVNNSNIPVHFSIRTLGGKPYLQYEDYGFFLPSTEVISGAYDSAVG